MFANMEVHWVAWVGIDASAIILTVAPRLGCAIEVDVIALLTGLGFDDEVFLSLSVNPFVLDVTVGD